VKENVAHEALGADHFFVQQYRISPTANEMSSLQFLPEFRLSTGKAVVRAPLVCILAADVFAHQLPRPGLERPYGRFLHFFTTSRLLIVFPQV
jgi:hypothetical protein